MKWSTYTVNCHYSQQLCFRCCHIELANHCSWGKHRVRFLQTCGHNICQLIYTWIVWCVFLFKDISFNIHFWLINFELATDSTFSSYLSEAYLTHIFSTRHLIAFLHVKMLPSPLPLHSGCLQQQNYQQKTQKCKKHSTILTEDSWELKWKDCP